MSTSTTTPTPTPSKREKIFIFAIISLVCVLVGFILSLAVGAGSQTAKDVLDSSLNTILPNMWDAMVREFFTFLFFIIAAIFVIIFEVIVFLCSMFLGPFICLLGLIFAIIQIAMNRKWYSIVMIITAPILFLTSTIICFASLNAA